MQNRLTEALKSHDVDYADIRIEDRTLSRVIYRGEELDNIGSSRTVGGIVRALYKGGWGYATFNDMENLDKRVKEACQTARLVGKEETQLALVEPVVDEIFVKNSRRLRFKARVSLAKNESVHQVRNTGLAQAISLFSCSTTT